MIRRHVAVWATTPLLRMLALPAALLDGLGNRFDRAARQALADAISGGAR